MQPSAHRTFTLPLIALQVASLGAAYWAFSTDPGWLPAGETDWRLPVVLVGGSLSMIIIPLVGLILAFGIPRFHCAKKTFILDVALCALAWLGFIAITNPWR
jgi:hypothetical protein